MVINLFGGRNISIFIGLTGHAARADILNLNELILVKLYI